MLDARLPAQSVEHVRSAGLLLPDGSREANGELAAVVGEQRDDLDWAGLLDPGEEIDTAAIGLVGVQIDEDPARGAVDGNEQIVGSSSVLRNSPRSVPAQATASCTSCWAKSNCHQSYRRSATSGRSSA